MWLPPSYRPTEVPYAAAFLPSGARDGPATARAAVHLAAAPP